MSKPGSSQTRRAYWRLRDYARRRGHKLYARSRVPWDQRRYRLVDDLGEVVLGRIEDVTEAEITSYLNLQAKVRPKETAQQRKTTTTGQG